MRRNGPPVSLLATASKARERILGRRTFECTHTTKKHVNHIWVISVYVTCFSKIWAGSSDVYTLDARLAHTSCESDVEHHQQQGRRRGLNHVAVDRPCAC